MDNVWRLKAIREASQVVRGHVGGQSTNNYNLAQHQYGVAMICMILWPEDTELLQAALVHDVPERWLGDMPSTAIAGNPLLKKELEKRETFISMYLELPTEHELDNVRHERLKNADRLELWLWTIEEFTRGNKNFLGFKHQLEKYWLENPPLPEIERIINTAQTHWEKRLPETFQGVQDAFSE